MRILPVLLGLLLVSGSIVDARERVLRLPSGERFRIEVPMGYSYETEFDSEGNAKVKLENPVWKISIVALIIRVRDPGVTTEEWQRNTIITFLAEAMGQSAEGDYKFKALGPQTGTGQYCVFTDSELARSGKPPPGEYGYLTGGIRAWPGVFVLFQILSNDVSSPEYREAFGLFRTSFAPN